MEKKIVLTTGGSRGLGREMALNLAKEDIYISIKANIVAPGAISTVSKLGNRCQK